MEILQNLKGLDWFEIFIGLVTIVLACQFLYKTFIEGIIHKFGWETKKMREKREDHELLIKTSQNLAALQEKHDNDESELKECLMSYIAENRKENATMRASIQKIDNDNHKHWEVSKEKQNFIDETFKSIGTTNSIKEKQIESLIVAQKELLAEKINEKYKYYLSIKGIPEDEYDEFVSMHKAYNGVGGNHHGDAKFEYCINHLQVIPVETKLIFKDEEK